MRMPWQKPSDDVIREPLSFEGTFEELQERIANFSAETGCPVKIEVKADGTVELYLNNCDEK